MNDSVDRFERRCVGLIIGGGNILLWIHLVVFYLLWKKIRSSGCREVDVRGR